MAKVIAELCQNHNGDKEILKRMIHAAADAGADYVKVQSMLASELTYREEFEEGYVNDSNGERYIKRPYQPEHDRLKKMDLSNDDFVWFVEESKRAGVEPMATIFTRQRVDFIGSLGMRSVKVASYDCGSFPLIEDLKNYFEHIIVSTGASYKEEIERTVDLIKNIEHDILHCVTLYPTPISDLNLNYMNYLRTLTDRVGFSDHSLVKRDGINASILALSQGAKMIERHFTILDSDSSKDGPVSINPIQLTELVKFSRMSQDDIVEYARENIPNWHDSLGSEDREMTPGELMNRRYYRGRFSNRVTDKVVYNWE